MTEKDLNLTVIDGGNSDDVVPVSIVSEVKKSSTKSDTYSSALNLTCPECGSDMVSKAGPRKKRCDVCRHQWV